MGRSILQPNSNRFTKQIANIIELYRYIYIYSLYYTNNLNGNRIIWQSYYNAVMLTFYCTALLQFQVEFKDTNLTTKYAN